jgi:hypothetical protein
MTGPRLYEDEGTLQERDPEASPIPAGKLITQPYDLVITSLMDQINDGTVHLRHISDRPKFQRRYVWTDQLASRLIESILLNVPIPPCYLAQNGNYELDVIDGQQRIYSIFRFVENHFKLTGLEVLNDLNGKSFFELPRGQSRKISTYTLRCVVVTNDSDPEIRFEVFERLNSNTMPLNAQELRNSISRGNLIDLLGRLADDPKWLKILNRRRPDKRMRDEELILRFFAFHIHGLGKYMTPHKLWLDNAANNGRNYSAEYIEQLTLTWKRTIENCLHIFPPNECFRRFPTKNRQVVNRALMDLTMYSLADKPEKIVKHAAVDFYNRYTAVMQDEEFEDLITRSIDHKTRTSRRFEIWSERVTAGLF